MDDRTVDAGLRAALGRNRVVSVASMAGLTVVVIVLAALGLDEANAWLGVSGLALFAAAGWLSLVPLGGRRAHDEPSAEVAEVAGTQVTVVRASPIVGLVLVVAAIGMVLLASSFLVGDGLASSAQARRGTWLYVFVPVAPVLLLLALVLALRPDRVALTPAALIVRRQARETMVPWEHVRAVEPVPANPGLVLQVVREGGRAALVGTRHLDLSLWELRAVLQHYRDHPRDRAELGDPASLELIARLCADHTQPGPAPRWLPAPQEEVRP